MLRYGISCVESVRPVSQGEPGGLHRRRVYGPTPTAEDGAGKICAVIAWARLAGFQNMAHEFQDALLLLPSAGQRRGSNGADGTDNDAR
jgi:hypothetical protein